MGKKDQGVIIHEVTQNNRKLLPDFLLSRISDLLMHYGKYFPSTDNQLENTAASISG